MAQNLFATIQKVSDLDRLVILEQNFKRLDAITPEIADAIEVRYADFGQEIVVAKTGLDLSESSAAEKKIINAIGRYVALQKRDGKGASRTFQIIANRGLIDAAEVTVAKSKVTQGFEVLDQADMRALSFEQIIVDHPEEFSARALWYANRTLGRSNENDKPPADAGTLTQQRTESVIGWLAKRSAKNEGKLGGHTNAEIGQLLGLEDLSRFGRVLGNIQSRIDFACYQAQLPPLGLCVTEHFGKAWSQESRKWAFPVSDMQACAQSFNWTDGDLEKVLRNTRGLPGQASISWKRELQTHEEKVRSWAESLKPLIDEPSDTKISAPDFDQLAALERRMLNRKPAVRNRASRSVERGKIGDYLKKANGYKCQICEALGCDPISFIKSNGIPYVEAHHVTPVSELEIGSLSAMNIMVLCPNHHRQMHYGNVKVNRKADHFLLDLDGNPIVIKRFSANNLAG